MSSPQTITVLFVLRKESDQLDIRLVAECGRLHVKPERGCIKGLGADAEVFLRRVHGRGEPAPIIFFTTPRTSIKADELAPFFEAGCLVVRLDRKDGKQQIRRELRRALAAKNIATIEGARISQMLEPIVRSYRSMVT